MSLKNIKILKLGYRKYIKIIIIYVNVNNNKFV